MKPSKGRKVREHEHLLAVSRLLEEELELHYRRVDALEKALDTLDWLRGEEGASGKRLTPTMGGSLGPYGNLPKRKEVKRK